MQGDHLVMELYALDVPPIINHLAKFCNNDEESQLWILFLLQVWYANDSVYSGKLYNTKEWFAELCIIAPSLGYYPEPDKSIFINNNSNHRNAKTYFSTEKFKIKSSYRYLGGCIREGKDAYVLEKVDS
eukprot:1027611-Ditylum_brightwellii.AAC.1